MIRGAGAAIAGVEGCADGVGSAGVYAGNPHDGVNGAGMVHGATFSVGV